MNNILNTIFTNFKASFSELKQDFFDFINYCKTNVLMIILISFFTLLAYGSKLFFYSISIDTEVLINKQALQLNAWTSIGRFGLVLSKHLFGGSIFNPFLACFLLIVTLIVFSLIWSYVLNYFNFNKKIKTITSCIFPIIFLTAPLFAEQFNFILQGFEVALAIIMCAISVFFINKWIISNYNIIQFFLGIVLMIWGFATYQSIVNLYISGTIACYLLVYVSVKKGKISVSKHFFKISILKNIFAFISGYVLYSILNNIIRSLNGATTYLENSIYWGKIPASDCINNIIEYIKTTFTTDNIFYYKGSLLVFIFILFYAIINLFSKAKEKFLFLLASITLLISPYLLSIYLGHGLATRAQFSLQFVISFGIYFLIVIFDKNTINFLGLILSFFIALNQSYTVSSLLYSDYMKYEAEVRLATKISNRIDELNLGETPAYPVVFVGSYHPSSTPLELRTDVIGASFFEWDSSYALGGSTGRIQGFMNSIGITYLSPSIEDAAKAKEIAKTMDTWPNTGSVKFEDGIIVVKLSNNNIY